ncbi:hypothetical protein MBANPS3_001906 [Mucor bainieri]
MVHNITSLPPELLPCIFDHVDSIAQLATCRLVCRRWNYHAEAAMFGKRLVINDETEANQLCNRLHEHPNYGNRVKSMHFMKVFDEEVPFIYVKLLAMAFTPTMETLTGFTKTTKFFDILTSIADKNCFEFTNLKQLPFYPNDQDGFICAEIMKRLKGSKLTIQIQSSHSQSLNWNVINQLDGFNTLKHLELKDYIHECLDVDLILKKCHFLETLAFSDFIVGAEEAETEEVQSWIVENKVTREYTLKSIKFIDSVYSPALVEYLMYKYPNVTRFDSLGLFNFDSANDLHRIMGTIHGVHSKELIFFVHQDFIQEAEKFAKNSSENVTLEWKEDDEQMTMTTIAVLPNEVLANIFNQIDSVAQLAICRVVCQKWNYPAEQCMFGKKIQIKNEEQAIQLYGHLCRDPSKGKLIKHLDFQLEGTELPLIYQHLLPLAFTPSIQKLSGIVRAQSFFSTLVQIADNTLANFNQLQLLPRGCGKDYESTAPIEVAIRLGGANWHFVFAIGTRAKGLNWNVINRLGKLQRLTGLTLLRGYIDNFKLLEEALGKCVNLHYLTIEDMTIGNNTTDRARVRSWLSNNVRKVTSLKYITLQGSHLRHDLLVYLLYKYPNIKMLKSRSKFDGSNYYSLNRIVNLLNRFVRKELTFILPNNINMKEAVKFASSHPGKIDFHINKISGQEELVMKIK